MKRQFKILIVAAVLLLACSMLFASGYKVADSTSRLADMVGRELQKDENVTITYAGEFTKDENSLVWFVISEDIFTDYIAVECELLSGNRYKFKEIYKPKVYSKDIVSVSWKTESVFLINDTNCKAVVITDKTGGLVSKTDISAGDYPFVYHLDPPVSSSVCSFVDAQGNDI